MTRTPPTSTSPFAWGLLVLLLSILIGILIASPLYINVDSGMYLEVGRYLLEGRTPYLDYVELNPPLIHYINVIPVAVAHWLNINPIIVYKALVLMVLAYAMLVSRVLLRGSSIAGTLPLFMLFPIVMVFETIADYADFGQRDHLMALILIPWLLLRIERYHAPENKRSLALTLLVGFLAAIAMALRPYFVLPLALVELYFLARYRTVKHIFRAETVIVIVSGIAYLAHFALLPADARDVFFNQLIPFVQDNYESYSLYSGDSFWLLMNARFIHLILIYGASILLYLALPEDKRPPLLIPLFIFALGAYGVYLYQQLGFSYHAIPASLTVFLIFGTVLQAYWQILRDDTQLALPKRAMRLLVATYAISGGLLILLMNLILPALNTLPSDQAIVDLIEERTPEDASIFFVDSAMAPAFPLITRINRQMDMTYVQGFPIAFSVYDQADPTAIYADVPLPDDLQRYVDALEGDIARHQPDLVFINSGACYGCPEEFQIYAWLEASGFVASHLGDYTLLPNNTIENFAIFEYND
ncbi:MAG: hypothetical protein AAF846_02810 [Chloroflexota bacterium]